MMTPWAKTIHLKYRKIDYKIHIIGFCSERTVIFTSLLFYEDPHFLVPETALNDEAHLYSGMDEPMMRITKIYLK